MSTKQLIRDIAELKGVALTEIEVKDIDAKIAEAYLDGLLDNQIKEHDERTTDER